VDNTLRQALWGFLRPLVQLVTNLLSPEKGGEWEREFKRFLRQEPCWPPQRFTLYLHTKQMNGGWNKSGFINRDLLLEDVWSWITHPETYPEKFKWRTVFLWKSTEVDPSECLVACLIWVAGRVVVDRRWLRIS